MASVPAKADTFTYYRDALLRIAERALLEGPGFAQEGYVLGEAKRQLNVSRLEDQQQVLDAWHDLFNQNVLSWGYDLDNPQAPFFHQPKA